MCEYELYLQTPLACNNTLAVLPLVNATQRDELLQLEEMLYDEELTPKGHRARQRRILQQAGVLPSHVHLPPPPPPPPTPPPWQLPVYRSCDDLKQELQRK